MEPVAQGLNFPTSATFDDNGTMYVAESGLPFGGLPPGGVVSRIGPDGNTTILVRGLRPPVNGLTWYEGWLYISEGGSPGRISRLKLPGGERQTVLDGLPGLGNYHTNMTAVGPDRKLYFSQGSMTNSGIIGLDSRDMPWLRTIPHPCDVPGFDVTLTGVSVATADPGRQNGARAVTGAFAPFGTPASAGQRVAGRVPCTSSVMRCRLDGAGLELVAWGLRNAFGLGLIPDGRLLATDQGADLRGSRPIANCPDFLYEVRPGAWYGWPDFFGGTPVTDPRFRAVDAPEPSFLLANHAELPPPERPLLEFDVNACAVKFAVVPDAIPHFAGDLVVALFGDERPLTGPRGPRVGRKLVRISLRDRAIHPVQPLPLYRPIDVVFSDAAYVVDFGEFEITPDTGLAVRPGSGAVWKLPTQFLEA